uniref:Secreted protein n=1 Tax=Phlegmariurus squarrosus TaxID=73615 RepID=H9M879_PHLSQ|nr:hypothetical protein HusqMp104 [Phlegmariurus squarrosus]AEV55786.1 hypothetical protein HusqMp104 [Phlegmariurus squarrosus]
MLFIKLFSFVLPFLLNICASRYCLPFRTEVHRVPRMENSGRRPLAKGFRSGSKQYLFSESRHWRCWSTATGQAAAKQLRTVKSWQHPQEQNNDSYYQYLPCIPGTRKQRLLRGDFISHMQAIGCS